MKTDHKEALKSIQRHITDLEKENLELKAEITNYRLIRHSLPVTGRHLGLILADHGVIGVEAIDDRLAQLERAHERILTGLIPATEIEFELPPLTYQVLKKERGEWISFAKYKTIEGAQRAARCAANYEQRREESQRREIKIVANRGGIFVGGDEIFVRDLADRKSTSP